MWLTILFCFIFPLRVALAQGPLAELSVIFYGAGNYDDVEGGEDLAIFHVPHSPFAKPDPGSSPMKRDILKRNIRDLVVQFGRERPLRCIVNDISPAAAQSAAEEVEMFAKEHSLQLKVEVNVADFTTLNLITDFAFLDNPTENLFYDFSTARPFADKPSAEKNLGILQEMANRSRAGLLVTTYYHDAILAIERLTGFSFKRSGQGYPYIFPCGHVDFRSTGRYLLPPKAGPESAQIPKFPPIIDHDDCLTQLFLSPQ
jgi:hypothetical protein